MPRASKNSSSTTKKPTRHQQLTPSDLDSLVQAALLPAAPVTPTSPKKRKTAVVISDDDSDVVIVESPRPSPKKARASTPPPGSTAFRELPPVSISELVESNLPRPGSSISFGTAGRPRVKAKGGTTDAVQVTSAPTPDVRNPFEIALAPSTSLDNIIDASALETKKPDSKTLTEEDVDMASSPPIRDLRKRRAAPLKEVTDDDLPGGTVEMSSPIPVKDRRKKRVTTPKAVSDDDLPEVSELILSTPKKERSHVSAPEVVKTQKTSLLTNMLDLEAVGSDVETDPSDHGSDRYLATDDDGSVSYHTDNSPEAGEESADESADAISTDNGGSTATAVTDNPDTVTSAVYQDSALAKLYEDLPFLRKFTPITPFSRTASATSARFKFSEIAPTLTASETDSLLKGMLFTQSDFYVNFARIHPNLLHQDGGRIRMARSDNAAAVGIFLGLCTNSLIFKSELIGPLGGQYGVHGMTVAGAEQDTRRFEALLGAVLKYDSITGNVNERGISFYTRGQGKNGSFGTPMVQSPPPARAISSLCSSVPMPGPATLSRGYPASRSFDDRIPVYDGREKVGGRKFTFSDSDFKDLQNWPLYRRGRGDVELDTVVAVGHTIGSYNGSQGGRFLSTNIHFVIVVGKPAVGL